MKRVTFFIFCLILNLTPILYSQTLKIQRIGNIRSGPGTSYEIIGKVSPGMYLTQIEKADEWFKVKLPDQKIGWIHKILITELNPELDDGAEYVDSLESIYREMKSPESLAEWEEALLEKKIKDSESTLRLPINFTIKGKTVLKFSIKATNETGICTAFDREANIYRSQSSGTIGTFKILLQGYKDMYNSDKLQEMAHGSIIRFIGEVPFPLEKKYKTSSFFGSSWLTRAKLSTPAQAEKDLVTLNCTYAILKPSENCYTFWGDENDPLTFGLINSTHLKIIKSFDSSLIYSEPDIFSAFTGKISVGDTVKIVDQKYVNYKKWIRIHHKKENTIGWVRNCEFYPSEIVLVYLHGKGKVVRPEGSVVNINEDLSQ